MKAGPNRGALRYAAAILAGLGLMAGSGLGQSLSPDATPSSALSGICPDRAELPKDASLRRNPVDGTVVQLKGSDLSRSLERDARFRNLQNEERDQDLALCFMHAFRRLFQLRSPLDELRPSATQRDDLGYIHVRLPQFYSGLPVKGAELIVHLNRDHEVYLVDGRYHPTPESVATEPQITAARAIALALAEAFPDASDCQDCRADLAIHVDGSGTAHLAYRVHIGGRIGGTREVWIDAETGAVLERVVLDKAFR